MLIKTRIDPSAITGCITSWAAHHIVPAGATTYDAQRAQAVINKFHIDVNSSANGALLPRKTGDYEVNINGETWATKMEDIQINIIKK